MKQSLLKTSDFECWKEENGVICCQNFTEDLSETSFEHLFIKMWKLTEAGLHIFDGKEPRVELIVSISDIRVAKKLCVTPEYASCLPNGYRIDHSLPSGEWKFCAISPVL